jgi:hypothetical protein
LLIQSLVPRFDYLLALAGRVQSDDIIAVYMHEYVIGGSTGVCMAMIMTMCVVATIMVVLMVVRHGYDEMNKNFRPGVPGVKNVKNR